MIPFMFFYAGLKLWAHVTFSSNFKLSSLAYKRRSYFHIIYENPNVKGENTYHCIYCSPLPCLLLFVVAIGLTYLVAGLGHLAVVLSRGYILGCGVWESHCQVVQYL